MCVCSEISKGFCKSLIYRYNNSTNIFRLSFSNVIIQRVGLHYESKNYTHNNMFRNKSFSNIYIYIYIIV